MRVVRGSSIPDVYRSLERGRAEAVETALNELESQEEPQQDISRASTGEPCLSTQG